MARADSQTRAWAVAILIGAWLWAAVQERYRAPAVEIPPAPSVVPAVPHPVGSAANAAFREAVAERLTAEGIPFERRSGSACTERGSCAQVEQLLARIEGSGGGKAVLLSAHLDSVPAGPGASDDGAGVDALLAVARALRSGPPLEHPVLLAFLDGEESGLLGAEALLADGVLEQQVGAVINLEARGTEGPSLMFENGVPSGAWIDVFARVAPHPITSSVFTAVYRTMPSDTDYTVYRAHGLNGFNLAFIGGPARYHTPLDDLAHRDPRTVAHLTAQALALTRALASGPLPLPRREDVVFFDVLAWTVLALRESVFQVLALVTVLLALLGVPLERGKLGTSLKALALGIAGALGLALVALLVAAPLALWVLPRAFPLTSPWLAQLGVFHVAFALAGLWAVVLGARLLRSVPRASRLGGMQVTWAVAGAALAFLAPGFAYPLVLTALAASIARLLPERLRAQAGLCAFAVAGLLLLPFDGLVLDALGSTGLVLTPLLWALWIGWLGAALPPLPPALGVPLARFVLPGLAGVAVALFALGCLRPSSDGNTPRHQSFLRSVDAQGATRLLVSEGRSAPRFVGSAPAERLPGLSVHSASPTPGLVRLDIAARPGAERVEVLVPLRELTRVHWRGHTVEAAAQLGRAQGTAEVALFGLTIAGDPSPSVLLDLADPSPTNPPHPFQVLVRDVSPGLGDPGAALLHERASEAVPFQQGDVTTVTVSLQVPSAVSPGAGPGVSADSGRPR